MMPTKDDDLNTINNNNNNNSNDSFLTTINNNNNNNNINNNNLNNHNNSINFCANNNNDSLNLNHNSNEITGNARVQNSNGLSKAELRKSNKPIMEKRRRARINHCLNELKTLILEAMKKDPARHTKLEKADILEMTVKHLQSIQRQQLSLAIQTDPTVIHKFKSGFVECADEVNRYITQLEGVDTSVRQRLSNHLNNCATGLEQLGTFSNFSSTYRSPNTSNLTPPYNNVTNSVFSLPQDVNNNGRIQMGGVQLIPSRLPSGEIALIMPNTNNVPLFLPNIQSHNFDFTNTFSRISAFSKPTSSPSSSSTNTSTILGIGRRPSATQTTTTTTTTTTPPLSPVSSVSSGCDDSMHTSSDFNQSKSPPPSSLNQSFSNYFSTPPQHLQQPHVSSTSETQQNCVKSETNENLLMTRKRRSCPPDDSNDSTEGPSRKRFKTEPLFNDPNGNITIPTENSNTTTADGSNDHMWRPW